jgi:hypothetical protein
MNVTFTLIYLQVCSKCLRNTLQEFKNLNMQLLDLIYNKVEQSCSIVTLMDWCIVEKDFCMMWYLYV